MKPLTKMIRLDDIVAVAKKPRPPASKYVPLLMSHCVLSKKGWPRVPKGQPSCPSYNAEDGDAEILWSQGLDSWPRSHSHTSGQ